MGYPVLSDRFFQEKRPTREFFARVKDRGPWSPSLLPVYEWQGVLYVAFSSLDDAPIAPDWCPVQANPSLMMELYFELTTSEEVTATPPTGTLAAESTPPSPAANAPFELADEASASEPAAAALSENAEADLGALDFSSEDEKREGGNAAAAKAVDLSALTVTGHVTNTSESETVIVNATPPPPPAPEFTDDTPPMGTISAPQTPPPAPPVKAVAAEIVSPVPSSPAAQKRPTPPPPPPQAAPPPAPATAAAKTSGDSAAESELWKKMSQHFEASMICVFQKGQVLPVKWSPSLVTNADVSKSYSTLKASPFRIVARTQKSYHGFLVPNEISDSFFHEWAGGQYPEHLTMSPILVRDLVVGFLMGWGKKAGGSKESLQLCESSAQQLGPLLLKYAETHRVAA